MENFCTYAKLFYVNIAQNVYKQCTNIWDLVLETDHITKILFCFFLYAKIGFLLTATKVLIQEWKERSKNSDINYNSTECPICMEVKKQPVRINCGHIFCYQCLSLLIKNHKNYWLKCPMCRSKVEKFTSLSNDPKDIKKVAKLNQLMCFQTIIKHPLSFVRAVVGVIIFLIFLFVQKWVLESCIIN